MCGIIFYRKGRGGYIFSALSSATFAIAASSLISFICLFFYELPTHHCPFCILQKEYDYVGYLLYVTLLGGGVTGLGTGVLYSVRKRSSMVRVIPALLRRLTAATLLFYLLFTFVVVFRMLTTSFRLG